MTISMGSLVKNKYQVQKKMRLMDKNRTTKEEREANHESRRVEKARRRRLENFQKCLAYSAEFDDGKEMAN